MLRRVCAKEWNTRRERGSGQLGSKGGYSWKTLAAASLALDSEKTFRDTDGSIASTW